MIRSKRDERWRIAIDYLAKSLILNRRMRETGLTFYAKYGESFKGGRT